jgi:hypothetical protein
MKREVEQHTMSKKEDKGKVLRPLTSDEIRIKLRFEKRVSIAELARRWTEELGRPVWASDISAVIARRPDIVLQEIREKLADFLGVDVSQVGREPLREAVEAAA